MLVRLSLAVLFTFSTHAVIQAQSLYHVQYNVGDAIDSARQDAFLVFFEDGTGMLRLRYQHNNVDVVVEADAMEKDVAPGVLPDSTRSTFHFINPRIITGKNANARPLPEIEFNINKTSGFAEPNSVIFPDENNQPPRKTSGFVAKHIALSALQKDFLLQFYSEDEDFFKSIFQPATRGLSRVEKSTKIHLLIVANTKEKIIGGSCALDKERTQQTFTELSKYLGINLVIDSVLGNNYNKKNVEESIRKLKPSANDIVVFYYSGHGYRHPRIKSRFPSIDLRSKPSESHLTQSMAIEDIYLAIKKKGARTNLVLSDCCNNDVTETNIVGTKPMKTKSSGLQWSEENVRQLFLNKTPISILATSADTGQKASGNASFGGFFSYFFKTSMENYCSKLKSNPTWDVVLQTSQTQTIHKASRTYCDKPYIQENICRQSPYYKVEYGR